MFCPKIAQANCLDRELLSLRLHVNFCRTLATMVESLKDLNQEFMAGQCQLSLRLLQKLTEFFTVCNNSYIKRFKQKIPVEFSDTIFCEQFHDYNSLIHIFALLSDTMLLSVQNPQLSETEKTDYLQKTILQLSRHAVHCENMVEKLWHEGFKNRDMDIMDVLTHVKCLMEVALEKHHIDLYTDLDLRGQLMVNPIIFHRVLTNLIKNSVEAFPEPYSRPKFIRVVVQQHSDHLQLCVSDNGMGIPPEVLQNLFKNNFGTKKSPSDQEHGWGISSVRHLVAELNGDMFINSMHAQPYSGTQVKITVPL